MDLWVEADIDIFLFKGKVNFPRLFRKVSFLKAEGEPCLYVFSTLLLSGAELRRIGKMKSLRVYRLGGKGKDKDKGQN